MAEKEMKEKKVKTPAKAKKTGGEVATAETMVVANKPALETKPKKEAAPAKPRVKAAKNGATEEKGASVAGSGLKAVPGNTKTPEEVKPETRQTGAPSREQIAQLAHRFWKERGGHHGSHEHDWLRAERELRGKAS
jgi:Protein of unknown function (DUF2934)